MNENNVKIVVTDSGLGGLSVLTELYTKIKSKPVAENTELTFFNALYSRNTGYNDLPDVNAKVEMFDRVLKSIEYKLNPDIIVIACNTLSVLYEKTESFSSFGEKIIGIVELAVSALENLGLQEKNFLIFGTPTTIKSGEYKKRLLASGVPENRIIQTPCNKLETEIENDLSGEKTKEILRNCLSEAKSELTNNDNNVIVLACTHYGFIESLFVEEAKKVGINNITCINPNYYLAESVLSKFNKLNSGTVSVKVLSRAELNIREEGGILPLIKLRSPEAANAVVNYNHIPDLF